MKLSKELMEPRSVENVENREAFLYFGIDMASGEDESIEPDMKIEDLPDGIFGITLNRDHNPEISMSEEDKNRTLSLFYISKMNNMPGYLIEYNDIIVYYTYENEVLKRFFIEKK